MLLELQMAVTSTIDSLGVVEVERWSQSGVFTMLTATHPIHFAIRRSSRSLGRRPSILHFLKRLVAVSSLAKIINQPVFQPHVQMMGKQCWSRLVVASIDATEQVIIPVIVDQILNIKGQSVRCPSDFSVFCSHRACPYNCHNHGICINGKCHCVSPWTGKDCIGNCPILFNQSKN